MNILMPFLELLYKIDNIAIISKINAILRMEETGRNQVNPAERSNKRNLNEIIEVDLREKV